MLKIELDLRLGDRAGTRTLAERLTHEHPLREEGWRLLGLALWADERQADALATLRQCRRTLAEEIGLDPGRAIVELERAILTGDRGPLIALDDVPRPAPVTVPRQLPSPLPGLVGRGEQLKRLSELADRVREPALHAVAVVLTGTAGVGKTSLAVHWARRAADKFPDGQLYADIRGFGAGVSPRRPGSVIREFLAALRVPRQEIPTDAAAQVGLYRSVLSGRRLLVVLDNARSADQVRPLLPGAPGCLVMVTSRHRLTGLIAGEGAHQVFVDVLTGYEGRDLLAGRIGADRVDAEPAATADIIAVWPPSHRARRHRFADIDVGRYQSRRSGGRLPPGARQLPADGLRDGRPAYRSPQRVLVVVSRPAPGRGDCRSALALFNEIGDQMGQAATLDSLGLACHRLGRYDEAADHFTRAAHILRQISDIFYEAQVLDHLGDARQSAGAMKPARAAWEAALRLLERLGHPTAAKVRAKLG